MKKKIEKNRRLTHVNFIFIFLVLTKMNKSHFLVLTNMNKNLATQLTFLIYSNKNIQTYLHKDFRGRLFLAHTKIQRTYL